MLHTHYIENHNERVSIYSKRKHGVVGAAVEIHNHSGSFPKLVRVVGRHR